MYFILILHYKVHFLKVYLSMLRKSHDSVLFLRTLKGHFITYILYILLKNYFCSAVKQLIVIKVLVYIIYVYTVYIYYIYI